MVVIIINFIMKISIKTLGCRLNQAESNKIAEELDKFGLEIDIIAPTGRKADLYIINTCCITAKAVTKSRREINKIRNNNKKTIIIGCGCAKSLKSEVDLFIEDKNKIPGLIYNKFVKNKIIVQNRTNKIDNKIHTRAFIKIQDGCNNFCTYCIIPYIREKMVSIESDKILKEIKEKERKGCKEILLTGVNIGKYLSNKLDLTNLVKKILEKTNINRIRFGSINPDSINDQFLSLFENDRICQHLHLSLQSGSDSVLKRMNRHYNTKDYLNIVKKIYKKYPDFNFTTDVIVGFPGESKSEFMETCKFVKIVKFSKIHIFPFSKREGTVACNMDKQINYNKKIERVKILEKINKKLMGDFEKKMLGKKEEILFENRKNSCFSGFTKNYFKVKLNSKENLGNKLKIIKILESNLIL